ncbi:MAG: FUN14 domain-containing protein [Planctomycetota bacterium]
MQLRSIALILLATVAAGSVGIRAFKESRESGSGPATSSPGALGVHSMAPDQPVPSPELGIDPDQGGEQTTASEVMPYVTEGSFFALIGFALGYLSRKVVKLGLILLAVLFLAVQGLSYAEVVSVDWDRALQLVNDLVLNLKENQTVTEVLKDRLPSAGGLVAGYALGFRKG